MTARRERPRMSRHVAWMTLLALTVAVGCVANTPASFSLPPLPSGRVFLANWPWTVPSDCSLSEVPPPTAGHVPCVITGHAVEGQLEGSNDCTWVTFDGSNERRALRWPPGYSAQFDPLVVYDPQGAVIARGGDHVLGDGWEPADASGPCGAAVTDVYSMHTGSPRP